MKCNVGMVDRSLRALAAAVLLYFAFTAAAFGPLQWLMTAFALIFVLTAIAGNCPIYTALGLKTCKT